MTSENVWRLASRGKLDSLGRRWQDKVRCVKDFMNNTHGRKRGEAGQDEIIIRPCWLCKVFLAQRGTTERGLPIRGVLCGEGMARFKSELLLNEHHLKQSLVESHSKAERTLLWNLNILNELTARGHQLINTHYKQGSVWLISAAVHLSTQIQWAAHSSTDEIFFLRDNME